MSFRLRSGASVQISFALIFRMSVSETRYRRAWLTADSFDSRIARTSVQPSPRCSFSSAVAASSSACISDSSRKDRRGAADLR
jgi:hypothetical protein